MMAYKRNILFLTQLRKLSVDCFMVGKYERPTNINKRKHVVEGSRRLKISIDSKSTIRT